MTGYPSTCACYAERGLGLSTEDKQSLLKSVARLNAAVPIKIGSSESWSNPRQTIRAGPHTPSVPLRRQNLSLGAPSNRRHRATSTQLQSHLVPSRENGKSKADRRGRAIA